MYCVLQSKYSYNAVHQVASMPRKRPKTKTAVMTMRVDPLVKAAAESAAAHDRRSMTSLIEVLVLRYCKELGIDPSIPKRE